jgi:hypothetical protein
MWRDALVSRGYTFDKLQPSTAGNLTSSNLAGYDMLVIPMSEHNYTNAEVATVTEWVDNGGGLLVFGDWTYDLADKQEQNKLLGAFDLWNNYTVSANNVVDSYEAHPIIEGCASLQFVSPGALNYTGAAYPLWYDADGNTVVAGQEFGSGRIIFTGDLDPLGHNQIGNVDNFQFGLNVANWLTAATAKVLVYADIWTAAHPNAVPLKGPVAQALNDLGIAFYMTSDLTYFNISLFRDDWEMVVFDNTQWGSSGYQPHLVDFVAGGGKLVFSTWGLNPEVGAYFGVGVASYIGDPTTVLISEPTHPIFNLPAPYGADNISTTLDLGFTTDALNLTTHANATAIAGYSAYTGAAITLGVGGNVIVNGPLLTIYDDDTDDSTYPDNLEIWENEIAFLYFDRPTIDQPADVTYMETETGNEITWTPVADAGPWEYVFKVNGTPVEGGRWFGGSFTFNVDGVNASLTEYELTVFDRLGYGVSDLVILNVTEYVAPPPGPGIPIDPTLLLIIGGAIGAVLILAVVCSKRGKKE